MTRRECVDRDGGDPHRSRETLRVAGSGTAGSASAALPPLVWAWSSNASPMSSSVARPRAIRISPILRPSPSSCSYAANSTSTTSTTPRRTRIWPSGDVVHEASATRSVARVVAPCPGMIASRCGTCRVDWPRALLVSNGRPPGFTAAPAAFPSLDAWSDRVASSRGRRRVRCRLLRQVGRVVARGGPWRRRTSALVVTPRTGRPPTAAGCRDRSRRSRAAPDGWRAPPSGEAGRRHRVARTAVGQPFGPWPRRPGRRP